MAGEYTGGGQYTSTAATAGVFDAGSLSANYQEVYGDELADLIRSTDRFMAYNKAKFREDKRPGGTYHEPQILTFHGQLDFRRKRVGGISLMDPQPATLQDATLEGSNMYGHALIDTETASRAARSLHAFKDNIGIVTEILMETGIDAAERQLWNGQVDAGVISKIAGATADPPFTGDPSPGTVTAVAGTANSFQLTMDSFSLGTWAGKEGSVICAISTDLKQGRPNTSAAGTVAVPTPATARMVVKSVDLVNRIITVKTAAEHALGTAVDATSIGAADGLVADLAATDRIFFATEIQWPIGSNNGTVVALFNTMQGIHSILDPLTTSPLGISNNYSKWRAGQVPLGSLPTSLEAISRMTAQLYGTGLGEKQESVWGPYMWAKLATDWSALKRGDLKTPHGMFMGANDLEVTVLGIPTTITCSAYCRGGRGTNITWGRTKKIGTSEVTDRPPGLPSKDYIILVPKTNTFEFMIYSNLSIMLTPSRCGNFSGGVY